MPTYQYECAGCGHAFELLQSMTEKKLKTCPKCKKPKLQRLIGTGGGIIFKGSGFYATDYKKSEKSNTSTADKFSKADTKSCKVDKPGGSAGSCGCTGSHNH